MKKNIIKIMVAVLLIGSLGTYTLFLNGKDTEAAAAVIWAHPKKAKEIGYTLTTKTTITRAQLNKISTHIDNKEAGDSIVAGLATSLITSPLSPYIGVLSGTAVSVLMTYRNTNGKLVTSTLKNSTKTSFKVTLVYKYRQTGSNDGYYSLNSVKFE